MQNHRNITIVDISTDTIGKDGRKIESFPGKRRIESAIHLRGRSVYDFYMIEWAGVDPENGDPLWYMDEKDANKNPTGRRVTIE